jgi:predicted DNA-binding transcriptional regulator YafY
MKRSVLARFVKLVQLIKSNPFSSLSDLASNLEVSERTIKRDIDLLRTDYDAPLEYDYSEKGYHLTKSWDFNLPNLTEGEVLALLIATSILHQFKGTPLESALTSLETKIQNCFDQNISFTSQDFEMFLTANSSPIQTKVDIKESFEKVFQGITQQKSIQIDYVSFDSGKETNRIVDPYHIFFHLGIWYFCGYCHTRSEIRDFALDRIKSCQLLVKIFVKPKEFDPKKYFNQAFRMIKGSSQTIQIKFDAYQSRWIRERIWHPSQKIKELPGGELLLGMEGNPTEIKQWVMGYGQHAEILQPKGLREEVRKEFQEMIKNMKNNTSRDTDWHSCVIG